MRNIGQLSVRTRAGRVARSVGLVILALAAAPAAGVETAGEKEEGLAPPRTVAQCKTDQDCDDRDAGTRDSCQRFLNEQEQADSRCVHEPAQRACGSNGDCDDGNAQTKDACVRTVGDDGEPSSRCTHESVDGECRSNADCDDGDAKTRDYCEHAITGGERSARCRHELALSGCRSDRDCDDGDPCTKDRCVRTVSAQDEPISSCSHATNGECARP
jgi:hypothetical protein